MPLSARNVLTPTHNATAATSVTTGSLAIPANSLAVVICHATADSSSAMRPTDFTLSNSAGLTLTSRLQTGNPTQWGFGARVWTCENLTGSTVNTTFTFGTGAIVSAEMLVQVITYTGYNTTTPIGGTATGTVSSGTGAHTLTLSAAPAAADDVIGALSWVVNSGASAATEGSGWTEVADVFRTDYGGAEIQAKTGGTSTSVPWTNVNTGAAPLETMSLAFVVQSAGGGTGPTINTQPSNQTVTAPATATFTVSATTSGGALSYQWQRSTNSGGSWANVTTGTGGTSASYTTAATSVTGGNANNGDQYRCVVTDSNGSTNSSAATLTVNAAPSGPTINTQPSNQTVTAPTTATFTVSATTSGGSLSYQWQRNTGSGWSNVSTGTGGTTASYTTPATSVTGGNANNGDQYRVQVTDTNGTTTSSAATLTVNSTGATLTTLPLVNNTGMLLSNTTVAKLAALPLSALTSVAASWTNQTSGTDGRLSLYATGLTAGTQYVLVGSAADGSSIFGCLLTAA